MHRVERGEVCAAAKRSAGASLLHELRPLEYLQVLRDPSERQIVGFGEFRDGALLFREPSQQRPSGRVRERVKDCVEVLLFNQVVEYCRLPA